MGKVFVIGAGRIPSSLAAIVSSMGIDNKYICMQRQYKYVEDYRDIEFKGKHRKNRR